MLFTILLSSALVTQVLGFYTCDADWTVYQKGGVCLQVYSDVDSTTAKANCDTGGVGEGIIVVDSLEKKDALEVVLRDYGGVGDAADVWIGLESFSNYVYTRMDGEPLGSYHPWVVDPATEANDDHGCVISKYVGPTVRQWHTADCSATVRTVCEKPATEIHCDPGWHKYGITSSCIKVVTNKRKNYDNAQAYCKALDGFLATTVISRKERSHVMAQVNFRGHFWIGFRNSGPNTNFQDQVVMADVAEPAPFRKGRPTATSTNECVTIKKRRWFDKNCSRRFHFVCEKVLSAP